MTGREARLEAAIRSAATELRLVAAQTTSSSDVDDVTNAVADRLEVTLTLEITLAAEPDPTHWYERLRAIQPVEDEVWVTVHGSHVDPSPEFPALDDGRRWNGWVAPRFRREVAELVVAWVTEWNASSPRGENDELTWDGDVLLITNPTFTALDDVERVEPDADGYYSVGAWRWTWTEVDAPGG